MLKFGQIVDLDLIERSAPNKYVQAGNAAVLAELTTSAVIVISFVECILDITSMYVPQSLASSNLIKVPATIFPQSVC